MPMRLSEQKIQEVKDKLQYIHQRAAWSKPPMGLRRFIPLNEYRVEDIDPEILHSLLMEILTKSSDELFWHNPIDETNAQNGLNRENSVLSSAILCTMLLRQIQIDIYDLEPRDSYSDEDDPGDAYTAGFNDALELLALWVGSI